MKAICVLLLCLAFFAPAAARHYSVGRHYDDPLVGLLASMIVPVDDVTFVVHC